MEAPPWRKQAAPVNPRRPGATNGWRLPLAVARRLGYADAHKLLGCGEEAMISKKILTVLLAAVSLPSFVSAQAPLPDADPAMWVVKDADTTIYLFGTVHALDGKRDWFNDEVKTAYDASKEVVFEILIPDPAKAQATILKLAKNEGGKGLSAMLTPEQAKKLGAELASVGAPVTAFDQFEPWFAATQLAQIRFMKKGIKPEHGVEAKLREAALKDGKTLGEVESFEWQMNLFDGLPKEMQLAMITGYLDEFV
jgi:uncharacterized protein YbaP (TraB family)